MSDLKHHAICVGDRHLVVVERGPIWLQVVGVFFDASRAAQYADVENDMADYSPPRGDVEGAEPPKPVEGRGAITSIRDILERMQGGIDQIARDMRPPPTQKVPDAVGVIPQIALRAISSLDPADYDAKNASLLEPIRGVVIPAGYGAEPMPPPVDVSAEKDEPEERESSEEEPPPAAPAEGPRVVANEESVPRGRDPLLVRPATASPVKLDVQGSSGQRLGDRIVADLDTLMRRYPKGPRIPDLTAFYDEREHRVREAVRMLFKAKKVLLRTYQGSMAQHVLPPDSRLVDDPPAEQLSNGDAHEDDDTPAAPVAEGVVLSDHDRAVFGVLLDQADYDEGSYWAKLTKLEILRRAGTKGTPVTTAQIDSALQNLERSGVITKLSGGPGPMYRIIKVNLEPAT